MSRIYYNYNSGKLIIMEKAEKKCVVDYTTRIIF